MYIYKKNRITPFRVLLVAFVILATLYIIDKYSYYQSNRDNEILDDGKTLGRIACIKDVVNAALGTGVIDIPVINGNQTGTIRLWEDSVCRAKCGQE